MSKIKRGEIYYADLEPVVGSEQGGLRPVLILQNNLGNRYSPTVIVAAIKNGTPNKHLPTHVDIAIPTIDAPGTVLLEQIRTIDKQRLGDNLGRLDAAQMKRVEKAAAISLGMTYQEG